MHPASIDNQRLFENIAGLLMLIYPVLLIFAFRAKEIVDTGTTGKNRPQFIIGFTTVVHVLWCVGITVYCVRDSGGLGLLLAPFFMSPAIGYFIAISRKSKLDRSLPAGVFFRFLIQIGVTAGILLAGVSLLFAMCALAR